MAVPTAHRSHRNPTAAVGMAPTGAGQWDDPFPCEAVLLQSSFWKMRPVTCLLSHPQVSFVLRCVMTCEAHPPKAKASWCSDPQGKCCCPQGAPGNRTPAPGYPACNPEHVQPGPQPHSVPLWLPQLQGPVCGPLEHGPLGIKGPLYLLFLPWLSCPARCQACLCSSRLPSAPSAGCLRITRLCGN